MFVFQAVAMSINKAYESGFNYHIEHNESQPKAVCALYFSSHDIYYWTPVFQPHSNVKELLEIRSLHNG